MNNLDRAGAALTLLAASLLTLAWHLCPLPELIRRVSDAQADPGTVD